MAKQTIKPKEVKQKPRVKRALKEREPKLVENTKKALIIRGKKTSEVINLSLKDLYRLKKPHGLMFARHNDVQPFEDETKIEFLCGKNDCSLFALGSHNKKRPHNLILGRLFDGHLLDMVELGVADFASVEMVGAALAKRVGSKPALVFQGDLWDRAAPAAAATTAAAAAQAAAGSPWPVLKSLLLDFFRGDEVPSVALAGLDHAMVCTAAEYPGGQAKLLLRHYSVQLRRSGTKVPKVALEPMGPSWDLVVRRHKKPSPDLWKLACRRPKQLGEKKRKNISRNSLGDKLGRVHLGKQDLASMKVRKTKALREVDKQEKKQRREGGNDEMEEG